MCPPVSFAGCLRFRCKLAASSLRFRGRLDAAWHQRFSCSMFRCRESSGRERSRLEYFGPSWDVVSFVERGERAMSYDARLIRIRFMLAPHPRSGSLASAVQPDHLRGITDAQDTCFLAGASG